MWGVVTGIEAGKGLAREKSDVGPNQTAIGAVIGA